MRLKFWLAGWLVVFVCVSRCPLLPFWLQFNRNLHQTLHTGRQRPKEELIRLSRSWDQSSLSRDHGNVVNSIACKSLKECEPELTHIPTVLGGELITYLWSSV